MREREIEERKRDRELKCERERERERTMPREREMDRVNVLLINKKSDCESFVYHNRIQLVDIYHNITNNINKVLIIFTFPSASILILSIIDCILDRFIICSITDSISY